MRDLDLSTYPTPCASTLNWPNSTQIKTNNKEYAIELSKMQRTHLNLPHVHESILHRQSILKLLQAQHRDSRFLNWTTTAHASLFTVLQEALSRAGKVTLLLLSSMVSKSLPSVRRGPPNFFP